MASPIHVHGALLQFLAHWVARAPLCGGKAEGATVNAFFLGISGRPKGQTSLIMKRWLILVIGHHFMKWESLFKGYVHHSSHFLYSLIKISFFFVHIYCCYPLTYASSRLQIVLCFKIWSVCPKQNVADNSWENRATNHKPFPRPRPDISC